MSPDLEVFFAKWNLAFQFLGGLTGVAGVIVAGIFGYLTWQATLTARDANQRANIAVNTQPPDGSAPPAFSGLSGSGNLEVRGQAGPKSSEVSWSVAQGSHPEDWTLTNNGPGIAERVEVKGLTDLDDSRLHARWNPAHNRSLDAGESVSVAFAQRFSASGPGTMVLTWIEPGDDPTTDPRVRRLPLNPR